MDAPRHDSSASAAQPAFFINVVAVDPETAHSALAILADSVVQPVRSDSDSAAQPGKVPIVEVAFKNGMWWSIPWGNVTGPVRKAFAR